MWCSVVVAPFAFSYTRMHTHSRTRVLRSGDHNDVHTWPQVPQSHKPHTSSFCTSVPDRGPPFADPPSLNPPCAVLRLLWWYRHTLPRFPPATCPRVLLTPCFIATGRGQGQAEPVAQSRSGGRDPSQEDGRGKSHVNNDSDNFNHNP